MEIEEIKKQIELKKARMEELVSMSGLPYYRMFKKYYFWTDPKHETEYNILKVEIGNLLIEKRQREKEK